MKNAVKNITFKIFIIVFISGIVGIAGILLLKKDIDILTDDYKKLIQENYENKEYMENISKLIYKHQAVVANHVRSGELAEMEECEEEETQIREELQSVVVEFGSRMSGGEKEKLYHAVHSNTISYLKNVDVVFELSRKGDIVTANFYVANGMNDLISKVNVSIDEMERMTDEELGQAKEDMDRKIVLFRMSAIACVAVIAIVMVVCLITCVRLTMHLEKYKVSLEEEVETKSRQILKNNERIMKIQNNTVIGMANLIESRDGETGEHIKRTSDYVSLLATETQRRGLYQETLTDEYIELLVRAAPMHDIGKIVVPDYILKKPGKLTDEEFDIMKNHAREGGRIVQEVLSGIGKDEYLEIASDVATFHHEKWNGKGYPYGKAGEEIPLCARIMAIADVFDALVSVRCYKSAMSMDEALQIIEKDAGSHFDPQLAEIFISLREEISAIMREE